MKIANQTSGKGRNSKFLLWGALGVLGAAVVGCAPAFEAQNPVVKNGSTILDQPFDPKVPTPKLEMDNAGKKSQAALMDEKPFFEGKKTIEVKPYKAPPKAVQKIEEERKYYGQPTSGIHLAEKAQNFELKGFSFTVDLDQKKMRFKGQLNKNGELLEAIDLEGTFNPGATLWSSNDLFPIDEKLRSERRIQATAICLDVNVCEKVAVRFYYLYNGEVLELHFERGAVSVGARPPLKDKIKNPSETEEPLEPPTELGPQEVLSDLGELQEVDAGEENDDVYLDFLSLDHQAVPVQPGQPKAKEGGDDELLPPDQDAEDVEENSGTDFKAALLAPGPTQTPAPKTSSDFAIRGIEKFATDILTRSVPQAMRLYNRGSLVRASTFPLDADGVTRRDRSSRNPVYAADITIQYILEAAKATEAKYPNRPPISVGHLSAKNGGRLGRHKSHQNGLDADIAFPHKTSYTRSFWVAYDPKSGRHSNKLDEERLWEFSKQLVCAKYNGSSPINAIFIDRHIKTRMCKYAKKIGEDLSGNSCGARTLRSYYHVGGHHHHIHVRFHCPGTEGCTPRPLPRKGLGC